MSWDEHPDAFDWMTSQKQFLPGEGLLVLESQERAMAFPVNCCRTILHDIPADSLMTNISPLEPEPHQKIERELNSFEFIAVMAEEAPYWLPALPD